MMTETGKNIVFLLLVAVGVYLAWKQAKWDIPQLDRVPYSTVRVSEEDLWKAYLMPTDIFVRRKNRPDSRGSGSCVQASLSMVGAHHHCPPAAMLLEDSEYGKAVLGGSWPERVADYCKARNIPIVNVEGNQSVQAIEACLRTGRYCGVTYGQAHMICAVGMTPDAKTFYIVDNNYPDEVRAVDRNTFISEHRGYAGGWTAYINDGSPPPWPSIGVRQ